MSLVTREGAEDPELSVCIPTLDGNDQRLKVTLAFVRAYLESVDYEIVVVDCQNELRGYTVPMNEAMLFAHGEMLLSMNDDVELTPGAVSTMLRAIYSDGAYCVTPDQTHSDGPQVFAPYCMLWHKDHWAELGGLDERFVWWCSDIDLARRAYEHFGNFPRRVQLPVPIEHTPGTTATGPHQVQLNEWALHDLDRYRQKWGCEAEQDKVRLAVLCGANQDPRLEHLR